MSTLNSRIIVTIFLLAIAKYVNCQSITEHFTFSSKSNDFKVVNSTTDKNGNLIYLTSNTTTWGYTQVQIIKLDKNNTVLFNKGITGTNSGLTPFSANAVATDDSNNIWISGTFNESAYLDPDSTTRIFRSYLKSFNGKWNDAIFILKLSPNGNFKWATSIDDHKFKGYFTSVIRQIKIGRNGSIFIHGSLGGSADFDLDPTKYSLYGGSEIFFVAKYSKSLKLDYVFTVGSNSFNSNSFIDLDSSENCYFGTGGSGYSSQIRNNDLNDIKIFRINSNGTASQLNTISSKNIDCIDALTVMNSNRIVFGGRFMDTLFLYKSNKLIQYIQYKKAKDTLNGKYTDDIFLCMIDSTGNFQFSKNIGNNYIDYIQDIETFRNNIFVLGRSDSVASGYSPPVYPNDIPSRMFFDIYDFRGNRKFHHNDAFPISLNYPSIESRTSATVFEQQTLPRNIHIVNDSLWKIIGTVFPSNQTYYPNYIHKYYPFDTSIYYKVSNNNTGLIQTYTIKNPKLNNLPSKISGCINTFKPVQLTKLTNGDYYEYSYDTTKFSAACGHPYLLNLKLDTNKNLYLRVSNFNYQTHFRKIPISTYNKLNNSFDYILNSDKEDCTYSFQISNSIDTNFKYYWHPRKEFSNDSIINKVKNIFSFTQNKTYQVLLSSMDKDGKCYSVVSKNVIVNCQSLGIQEENKKNNQFYPFPNPTANSITFQGIDNGAEFELLSASFQTITKSRYNDYIDLTFYNQGIYFIRLNNTIYKIFKL